MSTGGSGTGGSAATMTESLPSALTTHSTIYQVGRVVIQAPCTVRPLADWAIQTACGVTVTNNSFRTVIVAAQLVAISPSAAGSTMQPGVITWRLAPNQSQAIPNPPTGWAWVIADMAESQVRTIGWLVIGGLVVGAGFAGYGVYAATANAIGWAKRHHEHERGMRK